MTKEYKTVETSYEVWKAIKAAHNLVVFSSFTDIPDYQDAHCTVFTSYGFHHADFPVMEARSTWENGEAYMNNSGYPSSDRVNEQHEYYLCLPNKQED